MKNNRLFQMLYILLEKETVTAPELSKRLEVSVRTVYRDVEALSLAGVPIYTSVGKGGGISLMQEYAFDKALLSDDEQNQILFAIQSLQATDLNVDTLLSKLGGMFQKQDTNWIKVDFTRWGFGQVDKERFETIKDAILNKQILHIHYCGTNGKTSERKIKPFQLVYKDKSWYLQAYCLKAEDFRLFKVSRMTDLAPTHERFTESFSNVPSFESDIPMTIDTSTVTLLFSPDVAFRVYDEFHPDCIKKAPDGSLLVLVDFPLDDWVLHYLFSYGPSVRVIEPAELKERIAQYAKTIYEHYKT